ncbi:CHAT domain-containing protein [Desulfobacterales bacterium HSG16]|nr:CHAT domain-containing protein [Desulfobacterales bacterium HSG16]
MRRKQILILLILSLPLWATLKNGAWAKAFPEQKQLIREGRFYNEKKIEENDLKTMDSVTSRKKIEENDLKTMDSATLRKKGESFYRNGDFENAALYWEYAIIRIDPAKEPGVYLDMAMHLADAFQSSGYYKKSLSTLQKAFPVVKTSDDRYRNALFLSTLGDIYLALGDIKKAVKYLEISMNEARLSESPYILASVMVNVGNALAADGDYESALAAYEESLGLTEGSKSETELKAKILLNLVQIRYETKDYMETFSMLKNALSFIEDMPDSYDKASAFLSLSLIVKKLQEKALSFQIFSESFKDLPRYVPVLQNSGKHSSHLFTVYFGHGEYKLSNESGQTLDKIIQRLNTKDCQAIYIQTQEDTDTFGWADADETIQPEIAIKRIENVERYLTESLTRLSKTKDSEVPNCLRLCVAGDELRYIFSGSSISGVTEISTESDKKREVSGISLFLGDIEENPHKKFYRHLTRILSHMLNEAMRIGSDIRSSDLVSYAYGYKAQLQESEKQYSKAIDLTNDAIFYAKRGDSPQILYLWQWQLGKLSRITGNNENAIRAYRDAIATLNPIRSQFFVGSRKKKDNFDKMVKPVYLELADLLLGEAAELSESDRSEKVTSDLSDREMTIRDARDTMELLKVAELEDFFVDGCLAAKKAVTINTLDRTSPHTALLYPIPLPDKLALLLTLPDKIKYVNVDVDLKQFNETVKRFRMQLQTRSHHKYMHEARQLYDWLVRPFEGILKEQEIETLLVVPDGVLRLIPFSTLNDGEHFLIEKYAIGTLPSISLTDLSPMDSKKAQVLLNGLSESRHGAAPLPNVSKEIKAIQKILGGKVLNDNEYTIENLTDEFDKNSYSIVHMATHGNFGRTPEKTYLLAYNHMLTMDRLEQLIRLSSARGNQLDLLVLSACQSGLGDERAALGLAGIAVKSGAKSAVATLWYVDDEATSVTFIEFYQQLMQANVSKAKALQNAQKKLIAQPNFRHPIYWAPFLLIGNWL